MTETTALLSFSRDKRGYEYFSLVRAAENRPGRRRSRVLYWFRTPPGVKVGRLPFDDEMRRIVEAQNPDLRFDWPRLLATPIPVPPADTERWRERRRAERAAREGESSAGGEVEVGSEPSTDAAEVAALLSSDDIVDRGDDSLVAPPESLSTHPESRPESQTTHPESRPESQTTNPESRPESRSRRRRGRRNRRRQSFVSQVSKGSNPEIPALESPISNSESRVPNPDSRVPNPES